LQVPIGSPRYPTPADAGTKFYTPMLAAVRAVPGVQSAGVISLLPLQSSGANGNFRVAGQTYASISNQPFAEYRVVSPGYFQALPTPTVRARDVSDRDDAKAAQVVLVNDVAAKQAFPNIDPVGQQLIFGTPGPNNPPVTVVGVVRSVRQASVAAAPAAELY